MSFHSKAFVVNFSGASRDRIRGGHELNEKNLIVSWLAGSNAQRDETT